MFPTKYSLISLKNIAFVYLKKVMETSIIKTVKICYTSKTKHYFFLYKTSWNKPLIKNEAVENWLKARTNTSMYLTKTPLNLKYI